MRQSTSGATSIETSNAIFNEVVCQSMADLNMLMTETPQGRYPYAGIPWYSTTFGRDGLITALQMLWIDPRVARGVLKRLADDEKHYNSDPKSGKDALAERATRYEEERTAAMERSHSLDNSAAALDLGIVLATASVITSAGPLLVFSYVMGILGIVLGIGSIIAPAMFVF